MKNDIDPDISVVVNGDIGVMNFSKIYSLIRSDMTPQTIKAGKRTPEGETNAKSYVSYKKFVNQETIGLFEDYLRYYDGKKAEQEFITYTSTDVGNGVWFDYTPSSIPTDFNSVDFLWNNVVEDETNVDRGLGVFKIVSTYNSAAASNPYGVYMVNNIGQSRIINGTPKTKVYFSTAEYDHTVDNGEYVWANEVVDIPKRATDLPSYSDVLSFDYPFSRDFNYCFELDLGQMDQSGGNDYMYNTDSAFLTNYLSSKLIDKYGNPVTPGSARFGFMFRSSENENLGSLSSYMPVGKPQTKRPFTSEGTTKYFPSDSIVFSIENPNGANVSVVGNGEDITVYSNNSSTSEGSITPMYTMRSKNNSGDDMHRYFTYDIANDGATGTTAVVNSGNMNDAGVLYGHIFKLPKGEYVLGASPTSGNEAKANIYFLAVQGQTEGTIGANENLTIEDVIEDVDFLLTAPTFVNYPVGLDKALFSYSGVFNTSSGVITNDYYALSDKRYSRMTFNNSPVFVTQLHIKCRKTEHVFMFNGQLVDTDYYVFTA